MPGETLSFGKANDTTGSHLPSEGQQFSSFVKQNIMDDDGDEKYLLSPSFAAGFNVPNSFSGENSTSALFKGWEPTPREEALVLTAGR